MVDRTSLSYAVRYHCAMTITDCLASPASPFETGEHGTAPDPVDREALVAALRRHGIGFLQPLDAAPGPVALDAPTLIAHLAAHSDPRLRHALAMLFLRQPELAVQVPDIARGLDLAAEQKLRVQYTAAVYLQRFWRTRLELYLPVAADLPDWFSADLALPAPSDRFGKAGLYALADRSPYNELASYDAMVELLFDQLEHERRDELAPTG